MKQELQLGEYDEELMQYEVLSGLTAEDRIAFPEENLREGMATADMAEMNAMGDEEMTEDGMMPEEGYMPDEGVMTEEMMPEEGAAPEEGGEGGVG